MTTGIHANARSLLARALVLFTLLVASTVTFAAQVPTKSPNDDNQYRFIELDNGLRAILVSDADADKAAASLNVPLQAITTHAGIDLLSRGSTKTGAVGAEAVVFFREEPAKRF